jgi:hypothetical protein
MKIAAVLMIMPVLLLCSCANTTAPENTTAGLPAVTAINLTQDSRIYQEQDVSVKIPENLDVLADNEHVQIRAKTLDEKGFTFVLQSTPKPGVTNEEYVNDEDHINYWVDSYTTDKSRVEVLSKGVKTMWGMNVINFVYVITNMDGTWKYDVNVFIHKENAYSVIAITADNCPKESKDILAGIVSSITLK